jgi:hypothetical protein
VTCIGHFFPSDEPLGELIRFGKTETGLDAGKVILKDLRRPTHAAFADLNGNDRMDIVLCQFGNHVGRFSWYENIGKDEYREHVLLDKPGALLSEVRDFNGDGFPDIAVLVAQEIETFFIYFNDGRGNFSPQSIFQKHPLYGHTYFETADFNGDGRPDLLVTNGDNGEYPSPLKPYHGVRIYLNRGDQRFEEAFFYPLNGAFKAVARDFDGDGDLDIAAIAYFPDYKDSPRESFVYLENAGDLKFSARTFRECIAGRWLTMDVADLDGDGDLEILLGSVTRGPDWPPDFLLEMWEESKLPFLILENTTR